MKFAKTSLADAMVIDVDRFDDDRGYFARTFCTEEFGQHGLETAFAQQNHSYSRTRGTLRGMHFQKSPHAEVKLVRVVQGALYDVIIDLRPDSPTYLKWESFELTSENARTLYVPMGFAHGFQTLSDDTHVIYQISHPYKPDAASGLRYDDPALGIAWPLPVASMSEKDTAWPPVDLKAGIEI
jgi:dTDP-4-dehydrorhamnose 3,5-epimerase